ncbi:MAG: ROK family protein [Anaerolineales bacterium]
MTTQLSPKTVLGIDIGGTGIKGAPVDVRSGQLLHERCRIPTPEGARPEDVAEVVAQIVQHFDWHGPLGVGFPAAVLGGVVKTASNIHASWIDTNAAELFSAATACPVTVLNDADAAGLAEMRLGAGRERRGLVFVITIGTGLGTALFVDGRLVPNTELGHLEIRGKDAERRASDVVRKAKDLSWEQWAGRFSEYLRTLERLFWPSLFILGGGASKKGEKFLPYLQVSTEVAIAQLRNEAGIVGAALAAGDLSQ